jgi:hypothetical protein
MGKAISVTPKKKRRGRPATGRAPHVPLRLPEELLARVDQWAATQGIETRSSAIRHLIELGLERKKTGK